MATTDNSTINGSSSQINAFGTSQASTKLTNAKSSTTGSNASDTSAASKSLDDNYNSFLKLLTTQMQNQDPTNPMDTNQMTSQLVQFSAVEQAIGTNKRLDSLLSLQKTNTVSSNLMYLGRAVEYQGDTFQGSSDVSAIELGYQLSTASQSTRIDVMDSKGNVVYQTAGKTDGGTKQSFVWDFKDAKGNQLSKTDTYKINIAPTPLPNSDTIKTTTYTRGLVTNVDNSDSTNPVVHVNGQTVPISKIVSVG